MINAADGTFYFPPNFKHATVEEYLDFWMGVQVPDEALLRFLAAHVAARAAAPDAGEDYPEEIPPEWARHYARAASAASLTHNLPEVDQDKVMQYRIEVDYQDGGDTIEAFADRYHIYESVAALDAPEPEAERLARLEAQIAQLTANVGKVARSVKYIEETVDDIDQTVDGIDEGVGKVKKGLDDVEEAVDDVHRTTRLVDATVAPRGTYADGTKSRWRRRQQQG